VSSSGTSGPERPAPGAGATREGTWRRVRAVLLRPELALPLVTAGLMLYLSFASPYFLTEKNLLNITEALALLGIAAAFATIVVVSGGIDLTPTVIFVNSGIVCYWALKHGVPIPLTILLGIAVGGAIGLINGLLIAIGKLNPFIVTLGTNFVFTGVAFVVTDGDAVIVDNDAFNKIGNADLIGNLPTVTVIMVLAFVLAFCILRFTRFGMHVFAIGGDENAARLSGVPVTRVKTLVYVVAGLAAGAAGVLLVSASGSAAPFLANGQNDLLTILAAVIIGGTALEGGRGTVVGTLVGIWLLGIISNGLVLQNISSFWQPVVVGTILLVAIVLDEVRRRAAIRAVRA
jgi:ribose transport system permease protein